MTTETDSHYTTAQRILDNAAAIPLRSRVRHAVIMPPCQLAHSDLIAKLAQLKPNDIVGHYGDRFDVEERGDHLNAIILAVYDYAKIIARDTAHYIPVNLHDDTGLLSDAASDIHAAFLNTVDRMIDLQAEAAE